MRCPRSKSRCAHFSCQQHHGILKRPRRKTRCNVLKHHRLYLPKDSRVCERHQEPATWKNPTYTHFDYSAEQVEDLINLLLNPSQGLDQKSDTEMKSSTGLTNEQFRTLLSNLPSLMGHYNDTKKAEVALSVYLNRLRTGHTYQQIAEKYNISRQTATNYIVCARRALLTEFVPNHLGFSNFTREDLLANKTEMAQHLYCKDNEVITVWDGTYVYCNKSHNHYHQKKTYSMHKLRNLVKPMVCVTPNGLFVDVFGPYTAATNDAKIMEMIFEKHSADIMGVLQERDIVLVDRGFRDCKKLFEDNGLVVKMPDFIVKTDATGQLTNPKGNSSRLVTASRFVIESRNGHMKSIWAVFDAIWGTYDLVHLIDDYRIGAALINRFYNSIVPNKNDAQQMAAGMLAHVKNRNKLAEIVKTQAFQSQIKNFILGDEFTQPFPNLTKDDLKKISWGNYQIHQMNPYCIEHVRSSENNEFEFYICPDSIGEKFMSDLVLQYGIEQPVLIHVVLKSRFRSNTKYRTFVLADASLDGPSGILEYCCECRHGLRTVGCCSHIMAVVGFLGYLRNHAELLCETAVFLNNLFVE